MGLGDRQSVSILLAAAAGWGVSRTLSLPLLDLTAVTLRMQGGNLCARAEAKRQDELGTLARVFNELARRVEEMGMPLRHSISDATYELHTPLTVLHSDLDKSQAIRLEAVSSGLPDLSRVEGTSGRHSPVPLNRVILETSELYASRAEQAGLAFSLQLPGEEIVIDGDETQLIRIRENILDNAIKFNRDAGFVRVGLHRERKEVTLRVKDRGIGIPESDLPHVFNRFHRGKNAVDLPESGLGQAIVKAVVEGHAGSLDLDSSSQGTTITIRLGG